METIVRTLPLLPRVCILGGKSFNNHDTEALVKALGQGFASALEGRVVVLTGGMKGVQETLARSLGTKFPDLVHLLPAGESSNFGVGRDIPAGATLTERMAIFGQVRELVLASLHKKIKIKHTVLRVAMRIQEDAPPWSKGN